MIVPDLLSYWWLCQRLLRWEGGEDALGDDVLHADETRAGAVAVVDDALHEVFVPAVRAVVVRLDLPAHVAAVPVERVEVRADGLQRLLVLEHLAAGFERAGAGAHRLARRGDGGPAVMAAATDGRQSDERAHEQGNQDSHREAFP